MGKWQPHLYVEKFVRTQRPLIQTLLYFSLSIYILDLDVSNAVPSNNKIWLPCLHHPLQSELNISRQQRYMSYFYDRINVQVAKLVNWCTLKTDFPNVNHLTQWLPCGYAHLSPISHEIPIHLDIKIHKVFIVVISFTYFKMDDSGPECRNTVLKIGMLNRGGKMIFPNAWIFCGQRKPWYEVLHSYKASIVVNVTNLRQPFYVTFVYVAVNHAKAVVLRMKSRMERIHYQSHNTLTFGYKSDNRNVGIVFHNWLISVAPGFVIEYLTSSTCCFIGFLDIFDGPEMLTRILHLEKNTSVVERNINIMLKTSYLKSYMRLQLNESDWYSRRRMVFIIKTRRVSCEYVNLNTPSVTSVKHHGLILNRMFLIKSKKDTFPNMSFAIRKFEGYNEGGCNFGGYAIRQIIKHISTLPNLFGPYCTGVTSNTLLIDGLTHLILDNQQTFLVIYAFGPYYEIDIDILLIESECEGIIDPQNACSPLQSNRGYDIDNTQMTYMYGKNYFLRCVVQDMDYVRIDLILNCVVIQFISYVGVSTYSLEIIGHMELDFDYKRPAAFKAIGTLLNITDITLVYVDDLMISKDYIPNSSVPISVKKLKYVRLWHIVNSIYEYPNYLLHLEITKLQSKCAIFNDHSHAAENQSASIRGLILTITSYCGYGTYFKPAVYLYIYRIWKLQKSHQKQIIYMVINRRGCDRSLDKFDVITMMFRGFVFHSVDVIGNKTLFFRSRDMTVNLMYQKLSSCSVYKLQYRIESLYMITSKNSLWINIYQRKVTFF